VAEIYVKYYGDSVPSVISAPESCGTSRPRKSPKSGRDPRRRPVLPKIKRADEEKEPEPKAGGQPAEEAGEDVPAEEREGAAKEPATHEASGEQRATSETEPEPEPEETGEGPPEENTDTDKPEADEGGDAGPAEGGVEDPVNEAEPTEEPAPGTDGEDKPKAEADEAPEPGSDYEEKPEPAAPDEPETPPESEDGRSRSEEETEPGAPGEPGEPEETGLSSESEESGGAAETETDEAAEPESVSDDEGAEAPLKDFPEGPVTPGEPEPQEGEDAGGICEPEPPEDDAELLTGMDDLLREVEREAAAFRDGPKEECIPEPSLEEIEEAASRSIAEARLKVVDVEPCPDEREKYEAKIRPLARRAAEEVRKILQGRHSVTRRNLRKGNLDPSALWKISAGEPAIFRKRDLPGPKADVAVYLLIDCSGSMWTKEKGPWPDCVTRIDYASYAALMLHLMCRELNIPHAATGFTTEYADEESHFEDVLHIRIKRFNDRAGCFEKMFTEDIRYKMCNNIDGYSIRAAAKELSARPEEHKVLFVISDGEPSAVDYGGYEAINDTARAVREAERAGLRVIGLFIGRDDYYAKIIYPNLISLGAGDLPVVLARTLKKVITGPA
ncbi:MAG: cobaltochelatase CobT-related protein, partial [Thermacetogeniaceae bacterium]